MTLPTILTDEEARKGRIARTPIGRIGQPDDVAYGVLFLASDESSFMTGSELVIDGGRTAAGRLSNPRLVIRSSTPVRTRKEQC